MIGLINALVDRTTMYRLVLYVLIVLLGVAFVFGFLGLVPRDPTRIAFSTVLVLLAAGLGNWVFARIFNTPANVESAYITALIIALIMTPVAASNLAGVGALVFASVWAIASKFMLAIGRKHIFNPAALGVALAALLLNQPATWWVAGNAALLPFVLVGGVLIGHKLKRFDLIASFIVVNILTVIVTAPPGNTFMFVKETLVHSPLFFFAFVMLTEPLTAPQGRGRRLAYGALVGILFAPGIHVANYYLTPEVALLIGNVFAYLVSPKGKFALTLLRVEQAATGAYDFIFASDRKLAFQPGQYMEWTLGFKHPDNRGNRRQFTIASGPHDKEVRLGVRFYPKASTFKRALGEMLPGDKIYASQLAGNFVLPKRTQQKIALIAGGIGITPYRSMLEHLLARNERRPAIVLYGNNRIEDIAYGDVLERARTQLDIPTVFAVAEGEIPAGGRRGFIDGALIAAEVPDYCERLFYISGPHPMVTKVTRTLRDLGVSPLNIKTDFFPGLA